jgi:hypothetical protein
MNGDANDAMDALVLIEKYSHRASTAKLKIRVSVELATRFAAR